MINISKLKLTILQQEIMRLLFKKSGVSLNARNIAKLLEVSQPAISKALPLLEKESLIKLNKDKESKRLSISLNTNSHYNLWLKRVNNLEQLYESGFVQFLYDNFYSSTIILFGSYSFGEDTINSDIDIALIHGNKKNISLEKYEKILERKINLNYYESFKKINNNLLNNILNGIILKGAIDL